MHYNVSEQEIKQAKHPHELFLINLVTNHILVFVGLLGMAKTYPYLLLVVPAVSFTVLIYTLFRARRSLRRDPWFVYCHWQLGAQRSRFFIIMMLVMVAVIALVLLISGGSPKPQHYALGGAGILPMVVGLFTSDHVRDLPFRVTLVVLVLVLPRPSLQGACVRATWQSQRAQGCCRQ